MSSDKTYVFHCVICGNKFKVTRCDARTCSKICRTVLSQLSRYGKNIGVEEVTAEEQKKVDEKIEDVKSSGAKPEEPKGEITTTSFLGKKKKEEPATAPAEPQPAAEVEPAPEPAAGGKKSKKKK
jgi:predicted nucleic acid-binding Zn ribbon protein